MAVHALLLLLLLTAKTDVAMYGASWCGPCHAVRSFLDQNRVAYTYFDVDTAEGRAAYDQARGDFSGIPLTVVGGTAIRGANLVAIATALHVNAAAPTPGDSYGGHPALWWQAQFRQLRTELDRMDRMIAEAAKVSADDYDKEIVGKMKQHRETVAGSIDQLEIDASNVSLPRQYRE